MRSRENSSSSDYWGDALARLGTGGHYLDTFLGDMKRRSYLSLIERWGCLPKAGFLLKTDLFEESTGVDAFLADLCSNKNLVIGMDISFSVAQRARSRNGDAPICYVVTDVRRLPFVDDTFGVIVSASTLDHFDDPADLDRAMLEFSRALKPGGRAIVTLDNRQNVFDPLFRFANWLGWLPFHVGRSCTIAELRDSLELAGMQVQATTAILHNLRLVAVGAILLAHKIGWQALVSFVQRVLVGMQKFEKTPFLYYTGSFIAALAIKPGD